MATYSIILIWRITWTESSGELQSIGSQRVRQDRSGLACPCECAHTSHTNNHITSGVNIGLGNRHLKYVIFKQTIYWNVHIDDIILSTVTEKDKISWGPTVQFLVSITGIKGLFLD